MRWFVANARDLPWRRTLDPYAIWISEIMLQQTQVRTVVPYFERWMGELPAVARLATVDSEKLHKLWEGLGYYTRARNLQSAARSIVEAGGDFPTDFDSILQLKGVGRYTAGAVASIAFNRPAPIVDGNVIRVLARVFAVPGNPKDKTVNERLWSLAESLVVTAGKLPPQPIPPVSSLRFAGNCSLLNQSLMELGATVCTPKQPRCGECPVESLCRARELGRVGDFPETPPRAAVTPRRFVALVLERDGRWLLRQRADGHVNGGLWEFPNVEIALTEAAPVEAAASELGWSVNRATALTTIQHSITRYRIRLEVFVATVRRAPKSGGSLRWVNAEELGALPLPSAHGKIRGLVTKKRPPLRTAAGKESRFA